ncbi:MAG: helix-turn-helix domain-containing protein [Rubrobacter sp.]|nr:helix-turn-helix domain-containing protein [Rubrobacter sp.]
MEDGRHTHDLAPGGGANAEAKIGRFLEQARKERGLSLEEVEQATKIRKRYLAGLEREDYAMLPDAVYAQGFLKTYANFLGLDGEALSRQLKSRRKPRREHGINYNTQPESEFEEPLIAPRGLQGTEKRKVPTSAIVTLLVAVLVLVAVIGALYFVGRGVQATRSGGDNPPAASGEDPPRQEQEKVADKEKAPGAEPANKDSAGKDAGDRQSPDEARQPVPPDSLQVMISVRDRSSWLLIQTDGSTAYEQVARPGFSKTFEAGRQLYIKCGDAGAVSVEINGQDLGTLGPAATIVERNYTLKSAS